MKTLVFILLTILTPEIFGQSIARIETTDIDNFWSAYDQLSSANSKADSIRIIQENYIDKATPGFKDFIRIRKFSAKEYVRLLNQYPGFWKSIRPLTTNIANRKNEVEKVLFQLSKVIPDFKTPDICFAIGCLRTGGTTRKNLILIGSEIAASDQTVDKSEFQGWLFDLIGNKGDVVSMVAHEAVHTQQSGFPVFEIFSLIRHKRLNLLNMSIVEGSCDFITANFLDLNISADIHRYSEPRRDELFEEFRQTIKETPFDYSKFLYNGNKSKDRPADLGYYIGFRIAEGYYHNADDKKKALKTILKRGKYKVVYKKSGFND